MGGGGMGGMGGGGMGGMGGGFRSVPATGLLEATLQPRQARQLPTSVVSMNGPDAKFQPLVPAKGEKLQLGGIDQWTDDARTRAALKRLAEAKAPQTVAQMVLWYVTAGASWDDIGRLSQGWGNASEIALARQFVADLGKVEGPSPRAQVDPGLLYWEIKAVGARNRELSDGLRVLWGKYLVLGLSTKEGVPATPGGPALACRLEVSDSAVGVSLSASHPSGSDWVSLGTFPVKLPDPKAHSPSAADAVPVPALTKEAEAARLGDAVADAMLGRLVRVYLSRGPKVKGKDTFRVKIVNSSPLLVNGLALGGADAGNDAVPSVLAGLSLPPLKSLTVPASAEMVERLHLKDGVRVHAANLSGL